MYLMTVSTKFTVSYPAMMNFVTFPLVTFTYFLICLMVNDGMTLGTYLTKKRLITKNEYRLALVLTLNAITLNLFYSKLENLFRSQDYRYQELMEDKFETIDLQTLINEEHKELEENFHIAA